MTMAINPHTRSIDEPTGDGSAPADPPGTSTIKVFVTVGTELPFDRLVIAIDEWAGRSGHGTQVVAQIGLGGERPKHIQWRELIDGPEFGELFEQADVIVGHAGIGTILRALELERPLIVVPRRAAFGEHRNDHQLATVERLAELELVRTAGNEVELVAWLDRGEDLEPIRPIGPHASESLIHAVSEAITGSGSTRNTSRRSRRGVAGRIASLASSRR